VLQRAERFAAAPEEPDHAAMPAHHDALPASYLFVPGLRPDRILRALDCGADAVIVDLEDAVAPADKAMARHQVGQWLRAHPGREVLLRINAVHTDWHADDLGLAAMENVSAVVVPKAEDARTLPAIAGKPLLPMIESAVGFANAAAIAGHPSTCRLIFGTYDFRVDLGLGDSAEALLPFASGLVLVSRVAGLAPPIDGVMANLNDETGWIADARRARALGFGGKLCIHPRQVAAVNEGFAPNDAEIAWAQKIVGGAADAGVSVVDGQFVDRPILLRAQSILRRVAPCPVSSGPSNKA
jgi:citrate lyase subunit beta/citryl-CoA lyase